MNPEYTPADRPLKGLADNPALTQLAEAIQPMVRELLESGDPKRRPLKDLLHGTLIGHSLHPMLTDIPIGAWTVTAVCDGLEVLGNERYRDAADVSLAIGAAGAVGAALTGLADWSDTNGEPQRTGMLHALVNSTALACYLTSLVARKRRARRFGRAAGFLGYGLMTIGAYLGGELSFNMQLGAKHVAVPIEPPPDFIPCVSSGDLRDGVMHAAEVHDIPLLVTRFGTDVRAVSGVCTHRGAPLAEGSQDGRCVRCPWHGSRFSLENGRVAEGPATYGLMAFETQTKDESVEVRLKS